MKRRIIAALMCLCMLVGLLPMSAFAADPEPLKPGDMYYTFDGDTTAKENADITLSKTAVDKGDGTYEVTLTAQADDIVMAKATEVVFVIDGSGSMSWCTKADSQCNHNWGGGGCWETWFNDAKSRWEIALDAIKTMQNNLGNEGISYKYVVYPERKGGAGKVYTSLETLREKESPSGGTYLSAAVDTALDQFTKGDTNKVMIIVADGESQDSYPTQDQEFQAFKTNGGEVYTVGFTFSNRNFHAIASTP